MNEPIKKKDNRGGARPGSGPKKKAATILKELALENAHAEAQESLAFIVAVRKSNKHPIGVRVAAAVDIMDRVWGKSRQRTELTGKDGAPIETKMPPIDMSGLSKEALEALAELKDA